MKYCDKCGRKVDTDADICPYCGAPLREMQDGELSEEELLLLLGYVCDDCGYVENWVENHEERGQLLRAFGSHT